jgi:hypothetical protein
LRMWMSWSGQMTAAAGLRPEIVCGLWTSWAQP